MFPFVLPLIAVSFQSKWLISIIVMVPFYICCTARSIRQCCSSKLHIFQLNITFVLLEDFKDGTRLLASSHCSIVKNHEWLLSVVLRFVCKTVLFTCFPTLTKWCYSLKPFKKWQSLIVTCCVYMKLWKPVKWHPYSTPCNTL